MSNTSDRFSGGVDRPRLVFPVAAAAAAAAVLPALPRLLPLPRAADDVAPGFEDEETLVVATDF